MSNSLRSMMDSYSHYVQVVIPMHCFVALSYKNGKFRIEIRCRFRKKLRSDWNGMWKICLFIDIKNPVAKIPQLPLYNFVCAFFRCVCFESQSIYRKVIGSQNQIHSLAICNLLSIAILNKNVGTVGNWSHPTQDFYFPSLFLFWFSNIHIPSVDWQAIS